MSNDDASRRAAARSLCAHLHDDDRPPPRRDRERPDSAIDRKTLQLCAQVRRALEAHIPSTRSPELAALRIESVEPGPDAARLRVIVSVPANSSHPPDAALARLAAMTGFLRAEVAAAITRKRVPTLIFELTPRNQIP